MGFTFSTLRGWKLAFGVSSPKPYCTTAHALGLGLILQLISSLPNYLALSFALTFLGLALAFAQGGVRCQLQLYSVSSFGGLVEFLKAVEGYGFGLG